MNRKNKLTIVIITMPSPSSSSQPFTRKARTRQVLADIAERHRVLRLQRIRGLVGGLFRPNR